MYARVSLREEAVEPVENPAGLLRAAQLLVDFTGLGQGLANRLLGDFVKNQTVDRHLGLEQLNQMPADALSFAVFVRRDK